MDWIIALPVILIAALVMLIPGALLAWAFGLRKISLLAVSPALSVSLIAVASIAASFLKIPWTILPVLALTVLAALCAWLVRKFTRKRWPSPEAAPFDARTKVGFLALALSFVVISAQFILAVIHPENISQSFDNIFHLNAVRGILDSGSASPFTVGDITGIPFYPDGWHATVSLVVQLSGASIPVAVNATNLIISALVWPLGCLFLCRQVLGQSRLVAIAVGIVSTGFGAFPLMMVDYGVLYPNLLSIAILPSILALVIQVLGLSKVADLSIPLRLIALALTIPGLALAHPSTLMALLAFSVPPVGYAFFLCWKRWLADWSRYRVLAVLSSVGVLLCLVICYFLWRAVRPESQLATWPPVHSIPGALLGLLSNSERLRAPAILVSVLIVLGVIQLLRRRKNWWVLGMLAVSWFLFIAVSAFPRGNLRNFIAGIWYNDSYRLAALVPVIAIIPAALGASWFLRSLGTYLKEWRAELQSDGRPVSSPRLWSATVPAAIAIILIVLQVGSVSSSISIARSHYAYSPTSSVVNSDELAVINKVDSLVPKGSVIAANPWNGGALVYALADRKAIQLHLLTSNFTDEDKLIYKSLRDAAKNPAVCAAVHDLNIGYVLDFGQTMITPDGTPSPGISNLEDSGVATLLFKQGQAKLFKFTGCGLG
ncbi:DUF6541 family protein [Psychromicrobium lacuslunae]|uniref:Uncharacterized protein n=1 Tax=Psychromicrobium lacuslunae TaxID=1618207 RepID=A0A0D4BYM0_9MICC|nr:DUF6541 family protein [Psychromicrobium lacuslunae]AJT41424.1 hypothetical protein UM93_07665 [Psychromicrobium lacuslunae]